MIALEMRFLLICVPSYNKYQQYLAEFTSNYIFCRYGSVMISLFEYRYPNTSMIESYFLRETLKKEQIKKNVMVILDVTSSFLFSLLHTIPVMLLKICRSHLHLLGDGIINENVRSIYMLNLVFWTDISTSKVIISIFNSLKVMIFQTVCSLLW